MRISDIIEVLERAKKEHGDLPCFLEDSDIGRFEVAPCVNGVQRTENGVPEKPDEFTLIFHPQQYLR